MKKFLIVATVAALATAGCGIDIPNPGDIVDHAESAAASAAADATANLPTDLLDGSGEVDCSGIDSGTFATFGVAAQLMPQVSADSIDSFRPGGVLPYDADAVGTALDQLEVLRGSAGFGLGDPGEALDYFRANHEALVNLLAQDPVDDAALASYQEQYGDLDTWVKMQTALAGAVGEHCPGL